MKMKQALLITGLLITSLFSSAQEVLEYKSISINGITYQSSAADLISAFGEPLERYDPEYECGAYSKDQEGVETTELVKYPGFEVLLVNDKVSFESISFSLMDENFDMNSDQIILNAQSTIQDLQKVFPIAYKQWINSSGKVFRLLPCDGCDCEIQITFNKEIISSIEFWCPC